MKKIPTLFRRDPDDMRRVLSEVTPGCEWVLAGEGVATRKYDGTCVLIRRDGMAVHAFARREVKPGKNPPAGWVEVDQDPATGKRVGWEPAGQSGFAKFIAEAIDAQPDITPGTYELVGPKINGNPEQQTEHRLIRHGAYELDNVPRTYDELRSLLTGTDPWCEGWEGIVWHHPDGRMAKLKARDFPEEETR